MKGITTEAEQSVRLGFCKKKAMFFNFDLTTLCTAKYDTGSRLYSLHCMNIFIGVSIGIPNHKELLTKTKTLLSICNPSHPSVVGLSVSSTQRTVFLGFSLQYETHFIRAGQLRRPPQIAERTRLLPEQFAGSVT